MKSTMNSIWISLFCLLIALPSMAQIELSLRYVESDNKYHVYLRPTANPASVPNQFLTDGSSQITVTALNGNTAISNVISVSPASSWSLITTSRNSGDTGSGAPAGTDFFVFAPSGDFSSISYASGTEVELFNFSITGDCAAPSAAYGILPSGSQTAESGTLNIGTYYSVAGYSGGLGTSHFSATYNMVSDCDLDGDGVPNHTDNCPLVAGFPVSGCPAVALAPKSFLQGASTEITQPFTLLGTGLMRDALRVNGIIPTTEPYSGLGVSRVDSAGTINPTLFNTTGANAIVDWVLVELRLPSDLDSVVARQPALIQRDGDIVAADGTSPVSIEVEAGTYVVGILHRNHLPIYGSNSVGLSDSTVAVDLTTATLVGTNPAAVISGANYMWAGDANRNGTVISQGAGSDRSTVSAAVTSAPGNTNSVATFIRQGYLSTDINLDGRVIAQGANADNTYILNVVLGHPGNSSNLSTYIVQQQIPVTP